MAKEDLHKINEKDYIYVLKGIAAFCVVCAHVFPVLEGAGPWNCLASDYLNYTGTMGVPIFFIISGYLFGKNKKGFGDFWKGKIKSVFIPWFFCETMLWLYIVLRKGGITLKAWLLFMLGYQHTTYYLTILIIFYLLFWKIKKEWALIVSIPISIFSMICTGWDFGISVINDWTGTFYLNPLNWMCFFATGMLLDQKEYFMLLADRSEKRVLSLICGSGLYFIIMETTGQAFSYFSKYAVLAHIINVLLIFGLAEKMLMILGNLENILIYTGKISFSIYLLHQFIAGILVRAANCFDLFIITLMRPFIVVFIVAMAVWIIEKVCDKRYQFIKVLIGLR